MSQDQTETQADRQIVIGSSIMLGLYTLVLAFAIYNTLAFTKSFIKNSCFYLVSFYSLVFLDVLMRMAWLSLLIVIVNNDAYHDVNDLSINAVVISVYYLDILAT